VKQIEKLKGPAVKEINNMKYKVFVFLFLLFLQTAIFAQENKYQIVFSESGKRDEILSQKIDGKEYILIDNLQKIFSLGKNLEPVLKKIDLTYKNKKVTFFINSNEVRLGSQIRQLSLPVREAQKNIFCRWK
jgi:hypothetical protein